MSNREKLFFINERNEELEFSSDSPYHVNINDVSGLSDIRNEIFSITGMGQDGSTFVGSRIESRDIEIVGHLNETNQERAHLLRRNMNKILNPQFSARLIYEFKNFRRVINCTIDQAPTFARNRIPIFEEFSLQLSCLNPFWRDDKESQHEIAAWIGGFEFPIDRPEDDLPQGLEIPIDGTWEIGWREPSLIAHVFNDGDVRAGIRIIFNAVATVQNPTLTNIITNEFLRLNLTMQAGDTIEINTAWGEKRITLNRAGIITDAFRYIDPESTFLQLEPGENIFGYAAAANLDNLNVTIHHHNYFLGV